MGWNSGEESIGKTGFSIPGAPIMKKNNEWDKMAFIQKPHNFK
jgi:hypothetical protein